MFSLFMTIVTFAVSLKAGDPMFLIACGIFCISLNISLLRTNCSKKIDIHVKENNVDTQKE